MLAISLWLLISFISCESVFTCKSIPKKGVPPVPRQKSSIALIPNENILMLFGGNDELYYNDLWAFDMEKLSWKIIYPNSIAPDPRSYSASFVNSKTLEFCIFGGKSSYMIYNDLWCYNGEYSQWMRDLTENQPPPLYKLESIYFYWNETEYLAVVGSPASTFGLNLYM